MKKIAILACREQGLDCPGVCCLESFNRRLDGFSCYQEEDIELAAFMRCNGCDSDPETDERLQSKLRKLKEFEVDCVHVSACAGASPKGHCPRIETICTLLNGEGIETVWGTHGPRPR